MYGMMVLKLCIQTGMCLMGNQVLALTNNV